MHQTIATLDHSHNNNFNEGNNMKELKQPARRSINSCTSESKETIKPQESNPKAKTKTHVCPQSKTKK